MQYGYISGINKPVSRLVQGTLMVGGNETAESFKLLDQVFELGCTTFDTAHQYHNGNNERVIGRWVRERNVRDQVVVISKGAHHNADRKRVTPFDITSDLYDSLARFKFDVIDLYLLHRDDPSVPVEPIIEILNEHQQAGRIQAFGCSNWTYQRIQTANTYAQANGLSPFVASSPQFSLGEQQESPWPDCISISNLSEKAARDWYRQTQIPLLAWSPLAGGFFSGRFQHDNLHTFSGELELACIRAYASKYNFERFHRAGILAAEKGATVAQIALAYVMNQPLNIFAVVGASSVEKFKANLQACQIPLTISEMSWLELK